MGVLPLQTIGIAGPGLIGGSLALACRAAGLAVLVWTPDLNEAATLRAAGFFAADDPRPLGAADLVACCVPIDAQVAVAARLAPHLSGQTTVTDTASVKAPLEAPLRAILGERYVGAHPMAGNERSGFSAASAELFRDQRCFVTTGAEPAQTERAERFWRLVGCEIVSCPAPEHDATVARVSHLPVLVAAALVNAVGAHPERFAGAGPGFRDTTRVAASPSALWCGILAANRTEVRTALAEYAGEIDALRRALDDPTGDANLAAYLDRAARRSIALRRPHS